VTLPLSEQSTAAHRQEPENTLREWYSDADLFDETTIAHAAPISPRHLVPETTAPVPQVTAPLQPKDERSAPTLTMLSAYGESETLSQFRWWHGAILGLFILLFIGALGVGGWYWWSHRGSVAQTTPAVHSNTVPTATNPSSSPSSIPTSTIASGQMTSRSADEEITRLRERRSGPKASETSEILAAFQDAEKKYPNDYRFPYERAKLSIQGIATHHEAFSALALAASKAIDNGKAQEMLDSLMADKEGDFYKLSRGHHEWQALVQALSNKDKQSLNGLHH
jgi:predicted negative regulator of RcsB-dependent stress response